MSNCAPGQPVRPETCRMFVRPIAAAAVPVVRRRPPAAIDVAFACGMIRRSARHRSSHAGWTAVLVIGSAIALAAGYRVAAQSDDALQKWGAATGEALTKCLPDAARWGLTVDPYPPFSAFANETYVYKGAQSMVRKYPSYVVHQTWNFNDPGLEREEADLKRERDALQAAFPEQLEDFRRAHAADRQAAEQAYQAEHQKAEQQLAARAKHLQDLANQGKFQEMAQLGEKMGEPSPALGPFEYPPEQALLDGYRGEQKKLDERARALANRHRTVNFAIYANRTPTATAPKFHPKPAGTLAGHPLWRQDEGQFEKDGHWYRDLAVGVGPPDFRMPQVPIGHKELAIKTIVVWAFIESRPDSVAADEAVVRNVLETIDYAALAGLIAP